MNLVLVTGKTVRLCCRVICLDSCFGCLVSLVPEMSGLCSYQSVLVWNLNIRKSHLACIFVTQGSVQVWLETQLATFQGGFAKRSFTDSAKGPCG